MTITPDQARELLAGSTPGPWRALHDQWEDEDGTPCEDFYVLGGPDGILHTEDFDPDTHNPVANTTLAASAPDLAEAIAAQTWEYGVQWDSDHISWLGADLPECRRSVEENRENEELSPSVVRRLVGPVEGVE